MKNKNKLSILLILGLMSCSVNTPLTDEKISYGINNKLNNRTLNNHIDIDVGQAKSGASFTVNIDTTKIFNTGFTTKTNGSAAKVLADVASYEVYLIKNMVSPYPTSGTADPIADKVAGPFTVSSTGLSPQNITFKNVPASGANNNYYVAVRALDSASKSLLKANSSWTGTTANSTYNGEVAVTSSGVTVDSTFVVLPKTALNVALSLKDVVGSTVDTIITTSSGTASVINSYKLSLCTDPTRPTTSKVTGSSVTVNRNSGQLILASHTVTFANIPPGTYYVATEAYDIFGTSLIVPGNGSNTAYADTFGSRIAVSTNTVTISSSQAVTFSSGSNVAISIDIGCQGAC